MNNRLFFAVELPGHLTQAVANQVDKQLKTHFRQARWVQPTNYHITLYFLGRYRENLADLIQGAKLVAARHPAVPITVSGWGCFPGPNKPRVVYAAITHGDKAVAQLQTDLVAQLSLPAEKKPYKPHITVARLSGTRPASDGRWHPCSGIATSFALFNSELTKYGPRYTTVQRFTLTGIARSE